MRQRLLQLYNKYSSVFLLAVLLTWAKTYAGYHIEFELGVSGWLQHFILLINPIAGTVFILGLSLFAKNSRRGHKVLFAIYTVITALLYANIVYYREFADFLTFSTVFEAPKIFVGGENFITGALALLKWHDFIYLIDLPFFYRLLKKRDSAIVKRDEKLFYTRPVIKKVMTFALITFIINLGLAEISRPMLLTRTFDRNYIVKYLGLGGFAVYDSVMTVKASAAVPEDDDVQYAVSYAAKRYAAPDPRFFGRARGRNLIVIHMESIQQFLIDYHYTDEEGNKWEVMPFLNRLYHSKDSFSFSNHFAQIGQGKSSDAELMAETSLFGLSRGAAFIQNADNTFYAGPQILRNEAGYTSAAFHGNTGSFWNRIDMYTSLGYDYFFDADDFYLTEDNTTDYGLKDKQFFKQSVQYLEHLQQPFYAKFITLSNHFPFPVDENNEFPLANTPDESVNGYFASCNYADQALEEFFNYLKASGVYENSMIVLYGDHYGISDARNKELAPLIGRDPETWTEFDDLMMKRTPFIIHIPGLEEGKVKDTFAGQIDILPTVLHLLGIHTRDQIFIGQDMLAPRKDEVIIFRNGDMVSSVYTCIGDKVYDTRTGELIDETDEYACSKAKEYEKKAQEQLKVSDLILDTDLLAIYQPKGWEPMNKEKLDYFRDKERLRLAAYEAGPANTSIYYQNNRRSTAVLYVTDAPEAGSGTNP
ncbi:MAG: LTA synthase family protein [Caldicoprobacterales bacterium]|jgi:lipoteichoic acid synthase|nr:LTA synthase family protein [Clostridiales bacterium]